jgi:hypothetical protein
VQHIVNCKQGYAEVLLFQIKDRIDKIISKYQGTEPNLTYISDESIQSELPNRKNSIIPSKVGHLDPSRYNIPINLPTLPRDEPANPHTSDKDQMIIQMRDTITTLGIKAEKLETLLGLKDKRIEELVEILRKNSLI